METYITKIITHNRVNIAGFICVLVLVVALYITLAVGKWPHGIKGRIDGETANTDFKDPSALVTRSYVDSGSLIYDKFRTVIHSDAFIDLDTSTLTTLAIGKLNATSVEISNASATTVVKGNLVVEGNLDTRDTASSLAIGNLNASKVEIGKNNAITDIKGNLEVKGNLVVYDGIKTDHIGAVNGTLIIQNNEGFQIKTGGGDGDADTRKEFIIDRNGIVRNRANVTFNNDRSAFLNHGMIPLIRLNVAKKTSQVIPTGKWTLINGFDGSNANTIDDLAIWDNVSSQYDVAIPGLYMISAAVVFAANSTGVRRVAIVNKPEMSAFYAYTELPSAFYGSDIQSYISATTLVDVTLNEELMVAVYQTSGTDLSVVSARLSLSCISVA